MDSTSDISDSVNAGTNPEAPTTPPLSPLLKRRSSRRMAVKSPRGPSLVTPASRVSVRTPSRSAGRAPPAKRKAPERTASPTEADSEDSTLPVLIMSKIATTAATERDSEDLMQPVRRTSKRAMTAASPTEADSEDAKQPARRTSKRAATTAASPTEANSEDAKQPARRTSKRAATTAASPTEANSEDAKQPVRRTYKRATTASSPTEADSENPLQPVLRTCKSAATRGSSASGDPKSGDPKSGTLRRKAVDESAYRPRVHSARPRLSADARTGRRSLVNRRIEVGFDVVEATDRTSSAVDVGLVLPVESKESLVATSLYESDYVPVDGALTGEEMQLTLVNAADDEWYPGQTLQPGETYSRANHTFVNAGATVVAVKFNAPQEDHVLLAVVTRETDSGTIQVWRTELESEAWSLSVVIDMPNVTQIKWVANGKTCPGSLLAVLCATGEMQILPIRPSYDHELVKVNPVWTIKPISGVYSSFDCCFDIQQDHMRFIFASTNGCAYPVTLSTTKDTAGSRRVIETPSAPTQCATVPLLAVVWFPGDGPSLFAVGTWDGSVSFWNAHHRRLGCLFTVRTAHRPVAHLAWGHETTFILFASGQGAVFQIRLSESSLMTPPLVKVLPSELTDIDDPRFPFCRSGALPAEATCRACVSCGPFCGMSFDDGCTFFVPLDQMKRRHLEGASVSLWSYDRPLTPTPEIEDSLFSDSECWSDVLARFTVVLAEFSRPHPVNHISVLVGTCNSVNRRRQAWAQHLLPPEPAPDAVQLRSKMQPQTWRPSGPAVLAADLLDVWSYPEWRSKPLCTMGGVGGLVQICKVDSFSL